jgi:putative flippase GtrA
MKYTTEQIKSIGGKRFLKKRIKRILLLLVLCVGWIFLVKAMMNKPSPVITFAPLALIVINIVWGYVQSRNLFYEKVKKNPELLP